MEKTLLDSRRSSKARNADVGKHLAIVGICSSETQKIREKQKKNKGETPERPEKSEREKEDEMKTKHKKGAELYTQSINSRLDPRANVNQSPKKRHP